MASKPSGVEIQISGANVAFLLVHGFCAAPDEMATLGDFLSERNISSFAVQISGHNTTPEELRHTSWQDWYKSIVDALEYIKAWSVEFIFVAGISMGGALSALLASENEGIDGLVLIAPALKIDGVLPKLVPFLKYIVKDRKIDIIKSQEKYDIKRTKYSKEPISAYHELFKLQQAVRQRLPRITIPTLIIQGTNDKTINPKNGQFAFNKISSIDKQLHLIEGAEHVIPCHPSRNDAYPLIEEFTKRIAQLT
ncbi:alpha/beta fold hydrolase [Candidatus Thorarchaeota archaeon]|nr:MAG: alpha/beta fold hydrolase [Candidatus Thorarchaeota archaeon]